MKPHYLKYAVGLSVLAGILTIGLKYVAFSRTGSVGFLSDAVESIVNLVAALTAFFSLWYAAQPVDRTHTYGHEKIEFFSSGLEGMLILVAAGAIAWTAIDRLMTHGELPNLGEGMIWSGAAALVNLAVGVLLLRVGKAADSIVLEADGKHLLTDVWTSVGVIAGEGLVLATGYKIIDPIIALIVSVNIVWTGFDLVRRSFNGLMDHALPAEEQAAVRAAIEKQLEPGMTFHALRTRKAGAHRFIDFHLLVPGAMRVTDAHAVGNRIEAAVEAVLPHAEVVVHIEPIEEPAAWQDSALLPLEQAAREEELQRRNNGNSAVSP